MSDAELLVLGADSTRPELEEAIAHLRDAQRRLPVHFTERRQKLGDMIDALVDYWLAAE